MEIHGYALDGSIRVTIDGASMSIPDDMSNRYRRQIWDIWEMELAPPGTADSERVRVQTIPPYVAPEPEAQPYRLFKSVFIRRLISDETTDEAAIMEAVLAQADAKLRLMFNSVEFFVSDDPLFETLHAAVGAALGSPRADELLAIEA